MDFSANINPLGPPPGVFRAIKENLGQIVHYPDPAGTELKSLLCKRFNIGPECLILGNGAVELIYLVAHALSPRSALIPVPTFSEYTCALEAVQTKIRLHFLQRSEDFRLKANNLTLREGDILFICNPNNPTGQLLPPETFQQILNFAETRRAFVVVDESFMDFVDIQRQWRAVQYVKKYQNLFILYSLTKFYAIPGLRLGCGIGRPDLIERLYRLKDPWNVNSLALVAGEAGLQDGEFGVHTRKYVASERDFLVNELVKIKGLHIFNGTANFLLLENHNAIYGTALVEKLARLGILIRDCGNFPGLGEHYFRIAVKDRESNTKLVRALDQVLD